MITIEDYQSFRDSIIAQDDDEEYSESGWVACVIGDEAVLTKYSHCSCYDTWDYINNEDSKARYNKVHWDWTGSVKELYELAVRNGDPFIANKEANPNDYDYDHLASVYKQIEAWYNDIHRGS